MTGGQKQNWILILTLIMFTQYSVANGAGNEQRKQAGDLVFEFGIENKIPIANELVTMSLSVHNAITNEGLEMDKIWIRISKGNTVWFSSPDFKTRTNGPLYLTYAFPEPGKYNIDVSTDNRPGKVTFEILVKENNTFILPALLVLTALATGYFLRSSARMKRHF